MTTEPDVPARPACVLTRAQAGVCAADVLGHATRNYVTAASDLAAHALAEAAERADLAGYVRMRAGNCRRTEAAAIAVGDALAASTSRARAEAYEVVLERVEARATERGGP